MTGVRRYQRAVTADEPREIEDDQNSYLNDVGLPHLRPRGYRWFQLLPEGWTAEGVMAVAARAVAGSGLPDDHHPRDAVPFIEAAIRRIHPPGIGHAVVLISGIQAAGKSTVAQALAERLPRSVHVRGDAFRRMVVSGRADMTPDPTDEALRQLRLRYRLTATVADTYFDAGFTVVAQDVVLGPHLAEMTTFIRSRPLLVVVLAPPVDTIAAREAGRDKAAYGRWAIEQLDGVLRRQTPRIGLWLDTSGQTSAETADDILRRGRAEAMIDEDTG